MRRLPPLGALEAFVTVAQRQSLKAASTDLNLSPSALSRRVQALEVHVGRKVFERLNGEFRLTPEGQALLDRLAPAFDTLTMALDEARGDGRELLRLGVPPAFASAWLLPRLSRFNARHGKIEIVLDSSSAPTSRLATSLDAAIVVADRPDENFHARELRPQNVLAVCGPTYKQEAGRLKSPADLSAHTLLMHRDLPEMLEAWLDAVGGVRPKRVDYYDSGSMLMDAAINGLGVALVFDTMVSHHLASGRLVRALEIEAPSPLSYWFICRPAALASRSVRRFHDWLFEELSVDTPAARAQLEAAVS